MTYEDLLTAAENEGVDVVYHKFNSNRIKGLYCDGTIALNKNIETTAEKRCVLAEELGHHKTAVGNIVDQSKVQNRKQERLGRVFAYNKLIGLHGIVSAYKKGCRNAHEVAEYLGVTEAFLQESISYYKQKYGIYTRIDNYVIYFEPNIGVFELI